MSEEIPSDLVDLVLDWYPGELKETISDSQNEVGDDVMKTTVPLQSSPLINQYGTYKKLVRRSVCYDHSMKFNIFIFFQLMDYNIHYDPQTIVEAEHDIVDEMLKKSRLNAVQKKTVR